MGSLQVRLFTTYLFIISVTLGLAALSLLLQLGEYRDSISYGNLEDLGRLVNSQAGLVIKRPIQDPQAPAPEPNQLLIDLAAFFNGNESGSFNRDTAVASGVRRVISDEVVEERRVRNAMEWLAAIPDKRKSRDMPKGLRPYRAGALERFEAAGVHEPSARTEGGAVIWLLFSFVFLFGAAFWLAGQVNSLWPYLVPIGAVAVYVNFAGLVIGTRRDLSRYGSLAMQRVIEAEAAAQDAEWELYVEVGEVVGEERGRPHHHRARDAHEQRDEHVVRRVAEPAAQVALGHGENDIVVHVRGLLRRAWSRCGRPGPCGRRRAP